MRQKCLRENTWKMVTYIQMAGVTLIEKIFGRKI